MDFLRRLLKALAGRSLRRAGKAPARALAVEQLEDRIQLSTHAWPASRLEAAAPALLDPAHVARVFVSGSRTPTIYAAPAADLFGAPTESAGGARDLFWEACGRGSTPHESAELVEELHRAQHEVQMLRQQQESLGQFFSPVVRRVFAEADLDSALAPRETNLSVLFCDLRGFSRQAESQQLRPFLEDVSAALGAMTRQILAEEGVIGDFHGDAVMGFWGWPAAQADMVGRACRAALAIRARFETAGEEHEASRFRVGLGIATGPAIAGKIGTTDQVKVTAFGPVVNLASRLEGMTKLLGSSILLDETTAALVEQQVPATVARTRRLAVVRPYGLSAALTVSELLPAAAASSVSDEHIAQYEQALDAFTAGDWRRAGGLLDALPGHDRARAFLAGHSADHQGVPPAGWDGVIALANKG